MGPCISFCVPPGRVLSQRCAETGGYTRGYLSNGAFAQLPLIDSFDASAFPFPVTILSSHYHLSSNNSDEVLLASVLYDSPQGIPKQMKIGSRTGARRLGFLLYYDLCLVLTSDVPGKSIHLSFLWVYIAYYIVSNSCHPKYLS